MDEKEPTVRRNVRLSVADIVTVYTIARRRKEPFLDVLDEAIESGIEKLKESAKK
jgi:hypothetical protein